ncbi:hypothetical protein BA953_08110 [Vibrio coralliilyticus]|uniref:DUF3135 domain-containing protein n=1 Tax=Vibrio coralliilyticus TaxID=190893 RepID=UPI000810982E|nr:DUF3135 domain-containing protein [Vibrio coralliilyticus]ANW24182.1 hypothetical protein BA953_08110 [Vibrio coralliilyticus]
MSATLINQTLPTFDELMALAQDNPEAFNRFKKDMCKEMIQSASEEMQDRLWAQQSHIDRVVGRCKNPNHTNVVLMRELVSQMGKFHEALEGDVRDKYAQDVEVILLDEWR